MYKSAASARQYRITPAQLGGFISGLAATFASSSQPPNEPASTGHSVRSVAPTSTIRHAVTVRPIGRMGSWDTSRSTRRSIRIRVVNDKKLSILLTRRHPILATPAMTGLESVIDYLAC